MLIFIKERLVLFATPKTASTSIETTLQNLPSIKLTTPPIVKHTPYPRYKRLLEPYVVAIIDDTPDRIAAFREPVDWLGSWYRYRGRQSNIGKESSTHGITFDQFVAAYLQDDQPEFAHVGSQSKFVLAKDGTLGMSHLFRYDQLDTMVAFLEDRLKKRIKLPQMNVSPKAELSLSPDLLKELQNAYARDFEIYHSIDT
jgi:hypothetical protein